MLERLWGTKKRESTVFLNSSNKRYNTLFIINKLEKDIQILQNENKLLMEVKDICKRSNKSVMNIIINNYNEAPNLEAPPIEDMTKKKFQ